MSVELRISAEKCSKRVLALVLEKIQNENISVGEAFAQLLDQVSENRSSPANTSLHELPNHELPNHPAKQQRPPGDTDTAPDAADAEQHD